MMGNLGVGDEGQFEDANIVCNVSHFQKMI